MVQNGGHRSSRLLSILGSPWLSRRMVDVQDLDPVVANTIEDLVGIVPERGDPNIGAIDDTACDQRPTCDAGNEASDPPFDGRSDCRIMIGKPIGNIQEIPERVVCIDDLHRERNLANAASTSSSLAKRPSLAARRPRSMPASS